MNNCFIILAAGQSKRFKSNTPKQYISYKNKPILEHSIDKILESRLFKKIIIVTNNLNHFKKKKLSKSIRVIKGGKERSDSSLIGLNITVATTSKTDKEAYELLNSFGYPLKEKPVKIKVEEAA